MFRGNYTLKTHPNKPALGARKRGITPALLCPYTDAEYCGLSTIRLAG